MVKNTVFKHKQIGNIQKRFQISVHESILKSKYGEKYCIQT